MTLRLNGSSSGYVEIDAPAAAGSNTLTLPTGNGTSGQVLSTNGSGALSWQNNTNLTRGTSVSVTGNTSFTGFETIAIRKLTVLFDQVTRNTTSAVVIRLGTTGGLVTSGYETGAAYINTSSGADCNVATGSFQMNYPGSLGISGSVTFFNVTGNIWDSSGVIKTGNSVQMNSGRVNLGGTLSQISIFEGNGTGSLTGGTINVMYEV